MIDAQNTKYFEKVDYPWIAIGYQFIKQPDGSFHMRYYREKIYSDGRREDVTGNPELN